jgi:small multidrug resistance family-3 protein
MNVPALTEAVTGAQWTPLRVVWSLGVFLLAGLLEVGGGWLVWQGMKECRAPRAALAVAGTIIVAAYAWVPLLQPDSPSGQFGRIYAVYGCVFIALSYAWGAAVDGLRLDAGDAVGVALAVSAAVCAQFWPWRRSEPA